MTSHDEPVDHRDAQPASPKSRLARYVFAVVSATIGVVLTVALYETDVSDEPIFALLVGATAVTAWFGGFGPALVVIAIGWGSALWLLPNPSGIFDLRNSEGVTRWWLNLATALAVAGIGALLRARSKRDAIDADSTRMAIREIESLQQLSIALSGALSSSDVAHVVTTRAPEIVGARSVIVGLVEGDELSVIDRTGAIDSHGNRGRVSLGRETALTNAAREGAVSTTPGWARTELAVPLGAEGDVFGSVGFVFDRGGDINPEIEALAGIVGDLTGQALERARLYERERESRLALERILQVAPRFLADDARDVHGVICREARVTFGADHGVLWRVHTSGLELLAIDPPNPELATTGARLPLEDFPRLREAIRILGASFVPDVLETTHGAGLEFVRRLGIRSSLRTPVVISGSSELVLAISWDVVVSEPDPATLAVVRRFADQAGLALEQVERRRAEADAASRADATRRLQEVTAALSLAATPVEVSNTCLEHALESIGAEAGFVVLYGEEETSLELIASSGYDEHELEAWRSARVEDDVPFARAIASREPVWALSRQEMASFTGLREVRATGWVAIPLLTRAGVRGALHLSLRAPRELREAEREWLATMVAQCGQAFERSGLYEEEQRSRMRAERLQSMTALLSNALTTADVAEVVVDEVDLAVNATAIALVTVVDGRAGDILASKGYDSGDIPPLFELPLDADTPGGRAIRSCRSLLFESAGAMTDEFPRTDEAIAATAHETILFAPTVAGRRANGLMVVSWREPYRLSEDNRLLVESLTGQAAQALDRASHFEFEQTIAETLQRSVLPDSLPRVEGVELAARYLPGSAQLDVGGDWFDALKLPDGKLGLVVGDVVGKGVQAAASMAQLRNAIRAFSVEPLKPSSVLARLNRLADDVLDTTFATVAYLALDPEKGVCRLSSAGHPPPVVGYPDGRVELLEGGRGLPLGTGMPAKYRQQTIELPAGSVLVLYTDGLVERRGRTLDVGFAELRAAIARAPTDPDRLLEHILDNLVGVGERGDDIALLAARFLPVAPRPLAMRFRSSVDSMTLVRDAMRTWLAGVPAGRLEPEHLVLATWEACANAIEHAEDPSDNVISLNAELEEAVVRVVVQDTGRWTSPEAQADRGLGLKLIRTLMSSVDIDQRNGGTRITIEKLLEASPAP